MLPRNAVVAAQVTLGLAPEILDAVDVVPRLGEPLPVIDPQMAEL